MFVFAPVLPPAMQRRQWRIWLFGRHWFCRLMVSQINVQLISQLAANSSLGLSLPFLFHFFLLLRNIISHQVDEGRRNEMEIHPFISILVTLKSLDREMKRLQCSHQMYLMIIRDALLPVSHYQRLPPHSTVSPWLSSSSSTESTEMSVQLMPMPGSLVQCPLGKPVLNSQFHDRQLPTGVDVLKPSSPKQEPSFSTSPLGPPSSPFSLLKSSCPILGHLMIYESSFTATISREPLSPSS